MKIAILTLPLHTNYGGILQAYALQTVLERMGHEVCLIEKKRTPLHFSIWKAPLVYGKRILKNVTGHPFPIFYEQKKYREGLIVRQYTDIFIDKYIKRRIVDDFSEIHESDYDAIVVGSDQVWRPKYFGKIESAYLDFTEGWNIKRIAYAASFGTEEWEYSPEQTEQCKRLAKYFDAISAREISGVDLCCKYLDVDAKHVLDPTMLLAKEDYIQLFEAAKTPKSKGNLLCYVLDETLDKTEFINKIANERHLTPFRVNSKVEDRTAKLSERIQPPVEQWLRGFYDAEFVVTDSFHACVFSIMFNKPFIAIGNANRGVSRFTSLLSLFGLNGRLITDISKYTDIPLIDSNKIKSKLEYKKEFSKRFLTDCLLR